MSGGEQGSGVRAIRHLCAALRSVLATEDLRARSLELRIRADARYLSFGSDSLERFHCRADVCCEVSRLLLCEPALEADLEDGDADLGSETGGRLGHAARMQRLDHGLGQSGELDELALLELGMLGDERVSRTYELKITAVLELG